MSISYHKTNLYARFSCYKILVTEQDGDKPIKAHSSDTLWVIDETHDATCTEGSYTTYKNFFNESNKKNGPKVNDATGHNWGAWTSNNDGTHSRVCSKDGSHVQTEDCTYENGYCTECGYDGTTGCECTCHKSGIWEILWSIVKVIYKLFRIEGSCICGFEHEL